MLECYTLVALVKTKSSPSYTLQKGDGWKTNLHDRIVLRIICLKDIYRWVLWLIFSNHLLLTLMRHPRYKTCENLCIGSLDQKPPKDLSWLRFFLVWTWLEFSWAKTPQKLFSILIEEIPKNHTEMCKTLKITGRNYQPQLVSLPDFWTIHRIGTNKRPFSTGFWGIDSLVFPGGFSSVDDFLGVLSHRNLAEKQISESEEW